MKLAVNQNGSVTRENVVDLLGINPPQAYRILKNSLKRENLPLQEAGEQHIMKWYKRTKTHACDYLVLKF